MRGDLRSNDLLMTAHANRPPWRTVMGDMYASIYADTVETIFRVAIEPSCQAIAAELAACESARDKDKLDRRDALRQVQLDLHRSYALMLGGLWERNFQRHLLDSIHLVDEADRESLRADIKSNNRIKHLGAFATIRGFPFADFSMAADLNLLHLISSAARHGDGRSADKIHQECSRFFISELEPANWLTYFTHSSDGESSAQKLEINFENLTHFKNSVVNFWREIDEMRKNGN